MRRKEFEKLVWEGFAEIPDTFRAKIKNVALLVEDEPSKEICRREGLSPGETLLGLYHGIPETARGEGYGVGETLPDTITLFQFPIEDEAAYLAEEELGGADATRFENVFREKIKEVVAETVWHEFAHYFGLDESEVQKREKHKGRHG